jgi:hypothetical protein
MGRSPWSSHVDQFLQVGHILIVPTPLTPSQIPLFSPFLLGFCQRILYTCDMAAKNTLDHNCNSRLEQRQNQYINQWCYRHAIRRKKIENHPYFADLVTLLMFDDWQDHMNQHDLDIWRHCWQWSYHLELPLSGHHRRKLLNIIEGLQYRQQAYQQRKIKRQHIQARIQNRQQLAAV